MPEQLRMLEIPDGLTAWTDLPDSEVPGAIFPAIHVVYDNGDKRRFPSRYAMSREAIQQSNFDLHWQILISLVQDLYRGTLEYKLERFAKQLDLYGRGL